VDPSVFAPSTESAIEDVEEALLQLLAGPEGNLRAEVPLGTLSSSPTLSLKSVAY
jgi:hypothetical protein